MIHAIAIPVTLLVGGLLTSYAEYKLNYNLIDKIKDVFGYVKAEEAKVVDDVKKI